MVRSPLSKIDEAQEQLVKGLMPKFNPLPEDRDTAWRDWQQLTRTTFINIISAMNYNDLQEAEEVLQDTLLVVFRKIENGDFNYINLAAFNGYVLAIARTKLYRLWKRKMASAQTEWLDEQIAILPSLEDHPVHLYELQEQWQQLHQSIAQLPEPYREVWTLLMQGFETDEIAKQLNRSKGAVQKQKERGRDLLKGTLTNLTR